MLQHKKNKPFLQENQTSYLYTKTRGIFIVHLLLYKILFFFHYDPLT